MYASSYVLQNGGGTANSPVGDQGAALLVPNIEDTRAMLKDMNLDKNIPVGNSDAGSYFNNKVLAAIDYGVCSLSLVWQQMMAILITIDGKCAPMVWAGCNRQCSTVDIPVLPRPRCSHSQSVTKQTSNVHCRDR
jgi:hypothetical protein